MQVKFCFCQALFYMEDNGYDTYLVVRGDTLKSWRIASDIG
jgi:hypothetical protein